MRGIHPAILAILVLLIPCIAFGQTDKDVYKAFKKLESKVEVGMSYNNYSSALGDINYEVKMFLESPGAKANKKFAESIKKVMSHYKAAKNFWEMRGGMPGVPGEIIYLNDVDPRGDDVKKIMKTYPDVSKAIKNDDGYKSIYIIDIVDIIFKSASKELKNTGSLLQK